MTAVCRVSAFTWMLHGRADTYLNVHFAAQSCLVPSALEMSASGKWTGSLE
jgi:hypothetical protein